MSKNVGGQPKFGAKMGWAVHVLVPNELGERLDQYAVREFLKVSDVVREAIEQYLASKGR